MCINYIKYYIYWLVFIDFYKVNLLWLIWNLKWFIILLSEVERLSIWENQRYIIVKERFIVERNYIYVLDY